jgi:transposase-like protein
MGPGQAGGMKPSPDLSHRHRFPAEIISHAVWLYHVFNLSLRDVELLLVFCSQQRIPKSV